MSTITREWLQQKIADMEAARDEIPFGLDEDDRNTLAAMKLALASLEAEPAAYADPQAFDNFKSMGGKNAACTKEWMWRDSGDGLIPVYTAPPAPANAEPVAWLWSHRKHPSEVSLVRPEDDEKAEGALWSGWSCQALCAEVPTSTPIKDHQIRELVNELRDIAIGYHGTQQLRERIARTIRAAMLQGADGKPDLTVWYGAMPETNGKTNWTAMLHRKGQHPWEGITIDCSEYPDRVRYEADRMRHLIGELADEPDILAYDAEAHSGYVYPDNSSVIPDGWVACSERMPEEGGRYWCYVEEQNDLGKSHYQWNCAWNGDRWLVESDNGGRVTHWMPLPAAPQQEVK